MGRHRSGVLRVEAGKPGEVVLRCARLACAGCRRRVRAALGSVRGVEGVDDLGAQALAVGYEPARLSTTGIAETARRALEADPSNRAPVAVTYGTPRCDAMPLRRDPASTPIVETHAGTR
ncbi:MAG: hypothetical protein M0Z95_08845 [Actinomycetota bacterium]|nr:hypothetical protein [Actinomycetota bacterium]